MLVLTVIFPLIGFLLLALSHGRWSDNLSSIIGIGSISFAVLVTVYIGVHFISNGHQSYIVPLWNWISVDDLNVSFNLLLDGLSLTMLSIITGIGFLIYMFALWYMQGKEGYSRFFAYTNLFIAGMIILVLADDLLLMYLGWEEVGLCSYLLIGFYYADLKNCTSAMKAFLVTRVGDIFLVLALFILHNELGTLNLQEIAEVAPKHFKENGNMLWWSTLMLLGGAIGKSAQFPLQTWLADAMVGPTPVSALIHSATMVTAGVYLIARTHCLFLMTPEILNLVSVIGTITLLLAGLAAMVQTDIKRILAYSTMSQIGYMFLALGVQAWDSAIFHLMIHSFFKALLFLISGSIILSCYYEQNIFKMGGLWKSIPLIYIYFLVGSSALASIPLVTASFFSKDGILAGAVASGHINLTIIGLIGIFVTAVYTFRMVFVIFHNEEKVHVSSKKSVIHHLPLIILSLLSTSISTMIVLPLQGVLPDIIKPENSHILLLRITSGIMSISGILTAAWLWLGRRKLTTAVANSVLGHLLIIWHHNAWGLDWLYHMVFIKPFLKIAHLLKHDPLNVLVSNAPVVLFRLVGKGLLFVENGYLRWYVTSISVGALMILILLIILR